MSSKDYFVHPSAIVDSRNVGRATRIWAFCNVQEKAVIGADCNICDHCFIENNVVIGDGVTIKNGVSLWDGLIIEDGVFVGPNAVFTNDVYPRSKVRRERPERTLVKQGATIGANAVVVAGHTIGRYAFIGAGAVVTGDVPDFTLWLGNPAHRAGYVCKCATRLDFETSTADDKRAQCTCGLEYRLVEGQVVPTWEQD